MLLCVALVIRFSAPRVRALPANDSKLPIASYQAQLIRLCRGQVGNFVSRLEISGLSGTRKRQGRPAGFAIEVPGMRVIGVFERPFALDDCLGFRT